PTLLESLTGVHSKGDEIERYVIALSARQMHDELKRAFPDFWQEHRSFAAALRDQFQRLDVLRSALLASDPIEMPKFLDWFDRWFMKRAQLQERVDA
ncbi:MAG: hypothetical protein ACRDHN_18030, partial [Thermomicrobiales bacterium]